MRSIKVKLIKPTPPAFWRPVTSPMGLVSLAQRRDFMLVLNARSIPFIIVRCGHTEHIFTPALLEHMAVRELAGFNSEKNISKTALPPLPLHKYWQLGAIYTFPPILIYGLQQHWHQKAAVLPNPALWQDLGVLSGIKLFIYCEWWRPATAIWLHADIAHLAGNVFFGGLFLCLLARLCGPGHAWLLAALGAICGNFTSAALQPLTYASIGFSSVVFAALGAACGELLGHYSQNLLMPVAAGAAILAMIGSQGLHTDFSAHLASLVAGFGMGLLANLGKRRGYNGPGQWVAALLAVVLPIAAWLLAFYHENIKTMQLFG